MTQTIWKFPLELAASQTVEMPPWARVLHVDEQDGVPCLWALVTPGQPKVLRTVRIVGTGHPVPDGHWLHVGTWLQDGGRFVWHAFIDEPLGSVS